MKRFYAALLIALFAVFTVACSKSAGPAERMGRGLDEILEGGKEMQDKYGKDSDERDEREDRQKDRDRERDYTDSRHDLNSDEWWREHDRKIQMDGY